MKVSSSQLGTCASFTCRKSLHGFGLQVIVCVSMTHMQLQVCMLPPHMQACRNGFTLTGSETHLTKSVIDCLHVDDSHACCLCCACALAARRGTRRERSHFPGEWRWSRSRRTPPKAIVSAATRRRCVVLIFLSS